MATWNTGEGLSSSDSEDESSVTSSADAWAQRQAQTVNAYSVSLRRELDVSNSQANRQRAFVNRREAFLREYDWQSADGPSLINTPEASDLRTWCIEKSWLFCPKCGHLAFEKLLPSFCTSTPSPLDRKCKCGNGVYTVPQPDDVPLLLRNLTTEDIRVLRPFDIHCGEYKRVVHGYRQRTGPFRITWSALTVQQKILAIEDQARRIRLQRTFDYLMGKADSSYSKFVEMQARGVAQPYAFQIFTAPEFQGVECALWPSLYHSTALCESMIAGQTNRKSGKASFLFKVMSPVVDFSLDFELLQYQYDRWLFKTITGAINSSRASGCSPNAALQHKSFSATYWQWQHLYLLDAVKQYGFPSFFLTISPYKWTFPWPQFLEDIRQEHCLEPTDLPLLETLHVAHVLEQVARGYLTGANSNRWRHHVLNNEEEPAQSNLLTYFYRIEFQSRGTLHLHMLVWVRDLSLIRANLLHASIPWGNRNDAFLVADTRKSSSSCLQLCAAPDSFLERADGRQHLQFHYTPEDAARNLREYISSLLGALRCRTDVQLADDKAMLLKYVSSYVTKMHEAATVEGLYCTDVTGFQAANSFLRTVHPLAPEMAFQLSNLKVAWTDKLTKQFRAPHPGQEDTQKDYLQYLKRDVAEEDQSLLEWLRCHSTVGAKAKALGADKYLVAVKFVSLFNPVYFFQHLLVNYPHRHAAQLRHLEQATMPPAIQYFSQAVSLMPDCWSRPEQIRQQFNHEGHKSSFLTTLVSYVLALHDILNLWQRRIVDARIGCLQTRSVERLYPLSAL